MSDNLLAILKKSIQPALEIGTQGVIEATLDGVIGQIASGLVTFRLSYKQKRFEENTRIALLSLQRRASALERKLELLPEENIEFISNKVVPLMLDYVLEENESEKIEIIINSLETVIDEKIVEENIILTYNDVLKELRLSDLIQLVSYDDKRNQGEPKLNLSRLQLGLDQSKEGKARYSQLTGYENYLHNKLENLHLIKIVIDGGSFNVEEESRKKPELTQFGRNFLQFFKTRSTFGDI